MTWDLVSSLASGAVVGFTLGLVGGGGSILATPLLLYVVGLEDPHAALGTSAIAVSVNAYANLIGHARRGHVWWRCAALFALVGTLGALLGSTLGKAMEGQRLLFLFGLLMVAVGGLMLRRRKTATSGARPVDLRMCLVTGAIAILAGAASGFFGIGGGFLIVPGLILGTGMPMINAVGSSLLAVGTFGLATAANYAWSGLVNWPVAGLFIGGGVLGGGVGMRLASRLAGGSDVLNRVFAVLIFLVAAYVLWRSGAMLLG